MIAKGSKDDSRAISNERRESQASRKEYPIFRWGRGGRLTLELRKFGQEGRLGDSSSSQFVSSSILLGIGDRISGSV